MSEDESRHRVVNLVNSMHRCCRRLSPRFTHSPHEMAIGLERNDRRDSLAIKKL
jgi:hypothetical protein